MADGNLFDLFRETLSQIASEIVQLVPKIFLALIIIALAFVAVKAINFSLRKILKITKIDETFTKMSGFSLPFKIDSLILFIANLGVVLLAVYSIANLFLGTQYVQLMNEGVYYGARILSIAVIAIVIFAIFNLIIGKIRVETRLRSYAMLIVLLLITAMLVDITALSDPVKQALTTGLSLGVGISIGVFAFWFFFHEYFDKKLEPKEKTQTTENSLPQTKTETTGNAAQV